MRLRDRMGDAPGGGRAKRDMPPADRSTWANKLLRSARATLCDAKIPAPDQNRILRILAVKIEAIT